MIYYYFYIVYLFNVGYFFFNTPLIRGLSNDIWALVYIFENSNYICS